MHERDSGGIRGVDAEIVERWYARSGAAGYGLTIEQWCGRLTTICDRYVSSTPADVAAFVEKLALEDLALALGCWDGSDVAWEAFIKTYRPELYRAARAMAGQEDARDLADSLYAELFGVTESGRRQSLFAYYHGRSRLGTWLRAVLAQRLVDRVRARRRTEPLDDGLAARVVAAEPELDPDRDRLVGAVQRALSRALERLDAGDRLRLSLYYGQRLTLVEIGRVVGEHEASVSRKLTRARKALKVAVESWLREEERLDAAQIADGMRYAMDSGVTLPPWLSQGERAATFNE